MTGVLLKLFVKDFDDVKNPRVRSSIGTLSGAVGIICNLILFAAKLTVGTLAASVSITADAMNNLSDAASSIVTLIGFQLAKKPADEDHPYGHARYEYLSGLAVAALILIIGFELAKSSVSKIIHPSSVTLSIPMCAILIASILIKLWLALFNKKLGRLTGSSALVATSADSRNDAIATSAVLVAGVLELSFGWRADGVMGLLVALFILYSGITLARETISPLLGESASAELKSDIIAVIEKEPQVIGYHDLMVHDYGPGQRFASMHVEMDKDADVIECHDIIDNLERECYQKHNVHLVIHYDPVVTGDAELDRLRETVLDILHRYDPDISVHDFRMVRGNAHTNLIFDAALPAKLMREQKSVKEFLDSELAKRESDTTYYTVVTFDLLSFN